MITIEERIYEILEGASKMPLYTASDIMRCCFRYCNGNGVDVIDTVKYAVAKYFGDHNEEEGAFMDKLKDVFDRLS